MVLTAAIAAVGGLLIQLAKQRSEQQRRVFDTLLKPLFEGVETVHLEYRKMFLDVFHALAAIPSEENLGSANDSATLREIVVANKARLGLINVRKENENFRDVVRQDAAEFLEAAPGQEAKRFIYAIIRYFLDDHY